METSGHRTRSIFDRCNIISEDDLREAMQCTSDYVSAQTTRSTVTPIRPVVRRRYCAVKSESRVVFVGERSRLGRCNHAEEMAGSTGLEPATSGLTERYAPSPTSALLDTSHTYESATGHHR